MTPYIDPDVAAVFRGGANIGIFFRLDTDPVTRLWLGDADIELGIESIDEDGAVYLGGGKIVNLPDLDILINGKADRAEFFVSGVDADFMARFDAEAPPVKGVEVKVGMALLDNDYQPVTPIIPLITGYADFWAMERKSVLGADTPQQMIKLSVGMGDTARRRPALTSWSDSQQRMLSADDEFCQRVPRYVQSYTVSWPRF
jgi:hypothetical protein